MQHGSTGEVVGPPSSEFFRTWPDRAVPPLNLCWQRSGSEREGGLETPMSPSESALLIFHMVFCCFVIPKGRQLDEEDVEVLG